MQYLREGDLVDWYWAHSRSSAQIFARLHSFPSGLPGDKATQAKEAAAAVAALRGLRMVFNVAPQMERLEVQVRRDGVVGRLPWTRVVEGDVVLLEAGDSVWADVRVLEVSRAPLIVRPPDMLRQRMETREVMGEQEPEGTSFFAARNMAWAGSTVLRGGGSGVVVHTLPKSLCQVYGGADPYHLVWGPIGPQITSKKRLLLKRHWEQAYGLQIADRKNLFLLTSQGPWGRIVLHWKSPLLSFRESGEESPPVVQWVLGGKELEAPVEGRDGALLREVLRCCSVVSSSSLSLEGMKQWNSGAIVLAQVAAEGPRPDPVGAALLRFALGKLGAKQFWSHRQAGMRVFADGGKSTLALLPSATAYFWCAAEAVPASCSHYLAGDGARVPATASFWSALRAKAAALRGQRLRCVALGRCDDATTTAAGAVALPVKTGVFLGLVVFAEVPQTREEVLTALAVLSRAAGLTVVLRGEEEAGVTALARELGLLPKDFSPDAHVVRDADVAALNEAELHPRLHNSLIWITGNKSKVLRRTHKITSIVAPDPAAAGAPPEPAPETLENTLEFRPELGLKPWWQGLVPKEGPQRLLWSDDAAPDGVLLARTRGERVLFETSPLCALLSRQDALHGFVWVMDEEDDFELQFVATRPKVLTVAPPGMPGCAKAVARVILTHNSLLGLAKGLQSIKVVKQPEDLPREAGVAGEEEEEEEEREKKKEEEKEKEEADVAAPIAEGPHDNNAPVEMAALPANTENAAQNNGQNNNNENENVHNAKCCVC